MITERFGKNRINNQKINYIQSVNCDRNNFDAICDEDMVPKVRMADELINCRNQHDKISTVLDDKPTKVFGHFKDNKFTVGFHQFLLDCYPKLTDTTILDRWQTKKDK